MVEEQGAVGQAMPSRSGSLSPVALGLGVAGLLTSLVPFYGTFTGLPLSAVALVLGLTARARPWESRRQALGGIVTGALGLLIAVGWLGSFAWGSLGIGSASSQTSVSVGTDTDTAGPPPEHDVEAPPAEGPTEVAPGEAGSQLATGLSGEAELELGERSRTLSLEDCELAEGSIHGVLVRGRGSGGRLAVSHGTGMGELVLALDTDDEMAGTYTGEAISTGASSRGDGGLFGDSHRFELDGELRDLHSGETVEIDLTVTCD